jgi:hypothetical protein
MGRTTTRAARGDRDHHAKDYGSKLEYVIAHVVFRLRDWRRAVRTGAGYRSDGEAVVSTARSLRIALGRVLFRTPKTCFCANGCRVRRPVRCHRTRVAKQTRIVWMNNRLRWRTSERGSKRTSASAQESYERRR